MFEEEVEVLFQILLASLRLGPILIFAPPFTLIKIPGSVRLVVVVAVAAFLVTAGPNAGAVANDPVDFGAAALAEIALGIAMALTLQLAFASIAMAGRTLDIQAGFGLAFLIDPTTRAQTPLIGAIFTYAAAAVFFATSAPHDLLTVLDASFRSVPVGTALMPRKIDDLLAFFGTVAILAFGLVGLAILVLLLVDMVIAMLSRTLPQMNVLVLGFQVKSIVTLVLLPMTLGFAGTGIIRITRLALDAMLVQG